MKDTMIDNCKKAKDECQYTAVLAMKLANRNARIKTLESELQMMEVVKNQKTELLASCEAALANRDAEEIIIKELEAL